MAAALSWSSRLVALSVALQTLELLYLRRAFAPAGPLSGVAKGDLTWPLVLQLALCAWLLIVGASPLLLVVFGSYWFVIARLDGPFNGGSDALTSLSLLMLGIAALDPWQSVIMHGALAYLGVQTVFSYFVAGFAKLKEAGWRNGTALVHFASLPKYGVPARLRAALEKPSRAHALSWTVLLFECSFPCALLSPRVCLFYLLLGAGFHAANVFSFGLNRFFFSWVALYPLLWALSGWLP